MTTTEPDGPQDGGQQEPVPAPTAPATPTPKPSPAKPKPGPARPGIRPAAPAAAVGTVRSSDPHRFGRVDPDGTVWLITAVGRTHHRIVAGR